MSVVDFQFDQLSRIGNDAVTNTQKGIMNQHYSNYNLMNPYTQSCNTTLEFATSQPNLFFRGTYGVGPNGCNVEQSTQLQQSKNTTNNIKVSLHQRPYLSVPFLGRGNVNVAAENELKFGDTFKEKKSVIQMSETDYLPLESFPLYDKDIMVKKSGLESGWFVGTDTRELYKQNTPKA